MKKTKYKTGDVVIFVSDDVVSDEDGDWTGIIAVVEEADISSYSLRSLNKQFLMSSSFSKFAEPNANFVEANTELFKGNLELLELLYEK